MKFIIFALVLLSIYINSVESRKQYNHKHLNYVRRAMRFLQKIKTNKQDKDHEKSQESLIEMSKKLNKDKKKDEIDFQATKAKLEAVLNTHFSRDEKGCLPQETWCDSISRCIHKKKSTCPILDDIVRYRMFNNEEELLNFNKVIFSPSLVSVEDEGTIKIEDIVSTKIQNIDILRLPIVKDTILPIISFQTEPEIPKDTEDTEDTEDPKECDDTPKIIGQPDNPTIVNLDYCLILREEYFVGGKKLEEEFKVYIHILCFASKVKLEEFDKNVYKVFDVMSADAPYDRFNNAHKFNPQNVTIVHKNIENHAFTHAVMRLTQDSTAFYKQNEYSLSGTQIEGFRYAQINRCDVTWRPMYPDVLLIDNKNGIPLPDPRCCVSAEISNHLTFYPETTYICINENNYETIPGFCRKLSKELKKHLFLQCVNAEQGFIHIDHMVSQLPTKNPNAPFDMSPDPFAVPSEEEVMTDDPTVSKCGGNEEDGEEEDGEEEDGEEDGEEEKDGEEGEGEDEEDVADEVEGDDQEDKQDEDTEENDEEQGDDAQEQTKMFRKSSKKARKHMQWQKINNATKQLNDYLKQKKDEINDIDKQLDELRKQLRH